MRLQESSTGTSTEKQDPRQFKEHNYYSQPQSTPIPSFTPQWIDQKVSISPRQRFNMGWQKLQKQVAHINQLAVELEKTIWELKDIATQVNQDRYVIKTALGQDNYPNSLCEYRLAMLPRIEQKPEGGYVLKSRPLNLFSAEKEAIILARKLRQYNRRKRSKISNK